jgi:ABC-type multidrug transport system fused ATPase/permease subunit
VHVTLGAYRALLARYLRPRRGRMAVLGAVVLGNVGLRLLQPALVRGFLDGAVGGATTAALTALAALFLAVALVRASASVLETYLAEDLAWAATNDLRADLVDHCLRLDMGFHNAHLPGELVGRADDDVGQLGGFFSRVGLRAVASVLLLCGVLAALAWIDARISLAFAAFAAAVLGALRLVRGVPARYLAAGRETFSAMYGYIGEWLAGTEDVRARGAGDYLMLGLYERMRDRLRANRALMVVMPVTFWGPGWLAAAVGTALAYAVGGRLYGEGALSLGTLYLVVSYAVLVAQPLVQLAGEVEELQKASASIVRVRGLLGTAPAVRDGRGDPLPRGALGVEFDAVTFGYGDADPVLRGVSFAVRPAGVLGIVGRTGSGKTTIARLLARLYDPREGAVRLGGVDLRDARQADVRARVGLVSQDVQLLHASVGDNVRFFDPTIPDARILAALSELGLRAWYEALPRGLETELRPGGLSAGEAQLLAFARVFLKDPGLVVLDEASSRLDPATERLIEAAVDRLLRGRTAVVIAHRLGTLRRCDDVLVLEAGRVREHGQRERLAASPSSRFAALLRVGLGAPS